MILSIAQARQYAAQAGFTGVAQDIIVAIAQAESSLNTSAMNCNNPGGSCDRGILQINSYWHPEVSDQCAFDPACAFQQAFRISNNGTNFSEWVTYQTGAYQKYLQSGTTTSVSSTQYTHPSDWSIYTLTPSQYNNPPVEYGVDYSVPFHTPVPAIWGGKVIFAGRTQWSANPSDSSGGLVEVLSNVPGIGQQVSYYLHLDTANVQVGQQINPGQIVGLSGGQLSGGNWPVSPKYSTGPHIEVGFNAPFLPVKGPGKNQNPLPFIKQALQNGVPMNGQGSGSTSSGTTSGTSGYNTGSSLFDFSGLVSAINNLPNTIISGLVSNEYFQRGVILFIGILVILIAILVIFFSDPDRRQLIMEAGAAAA
jgi:hypothetical protein